MKETDIKYLAGLLDADGSFYFNFSNNRAYLYIALDLSTGIDKDCNYSKWLSERLGVKYYCSKRETNAEGVESIKIVISKRNTLEMLIPRLLKYLVIKGKHLNSLYNKMQELNGQKLTSEEVLELKQFCKLSRKDVGPLKSKEWLPKAYVAGFLDGDGSYIMKRSSGTYNINAVSHIEDRVVIDLLYKQYGGSVYFQEDWIRWKHPLGRTNKQFAIRFLRDMHKHSRLKKWKIEQFLNYHSQRLNEESAAAEVIV